MFLQDGAIKGTCQKPRAPIVNTMNDMQGQTATNRGGDAATVVRVL